MRLEPESLTALVHTARETRVGAHELTIPRTMLRTMANLVFAAAMLALGCGVLTAQPFPRDARGGDPWARMQQRDRDGDGRISRAEFPGPDTVFDRLDADRDGFLTRAEIQAARPFQGGGRALQMMPQRLLDRVDTNQDGQVSLKEWSGFFKTADENGDDILQPEEWEAAMRGGPVRDAAPAVGAPAPKVKARRLEDDTEVDLSKVRRPTVLVFGSFT